MDLDNVVFPSRIPTRGGYEEDVLSGWRRFYCYCGRPGVCRSIKQGYNRRLRRRVRALLMRV